MRDHRIVDEYRLETLEPRLLLSGDVLGNVNGKGDLVLRGDASDNHIVIEETANGILVSGDNGTTVNGQSQWEFQGVTRDLKARMRDGNDRVDIMNVQVDRDLTIYGGRGSDTVNIFNVDVARNFIFGGKYGREILNEDGLTVGNDVITRRVELHNTDVNGAASVRAASLTLDGAALTQTGEFNVMQQKLDQAIRTLDRPAVPENQHMQAINEIMEALFTSNVVILPSGTEGNPAQTDADTTQMFEMTNQMMEEAIQALNRHINDGKAKRNPDSKHAAAEARNFLQVIREAMEVIGQQTGQTDGADPNNPLLQADDEGGTVIDSILEGVFSRQVRSPFPVFLFPGGDPQEQVITPDGPIAPGEISVVLKEIQGIKVVVTPRIVPIWVEPWFARATVVGFKTVWVWEFVPAEFLKTISFHNLQDPADPTVSAGLDVNVQTQVVLERELLHFWQWAQKDITAV